MLGSKIRPQGTLLIQKSRFCLLLSTGHMAMNARTHVHTKPGTTIGQVTQMVATGLELATF